MAKNEGWPPYNEGGGRRGDPVGKFLTADGLLKSDRSLAGPLRTGTAPGVGPRGSGGAFVDTDFGMDKIRDNFDPIGTSDNRAGTYPRATRITRD